MKVRFKTPVRMLRHYVNLRNQAQSFLETGQVNEYVKVLLQMERVRENMNRQTRMA